MSKSKLPLLLVPVLLLSQWLGFAVAHEHESQTDSGRRHVHIGSAHDHQHGHHHDLVDDGHSASDLDEISSSSGPAQEDPHEAVYCGSDDFLASNSVGILIEGHRSQLCVDLLDPSAASCDAYALDHCGEIRSGFLDAPGRPLYLRTLSLRI